MIASTMFIYQSAVKTFLPMPSKSHYVFNLRDFARVMRGILLVPSSRMEETNKLVRLWIHEVYRVFSDRLTEETDRYMSKTDDVCCIWACHCPSRILVETVQ
jgi:dynein heavy chain